MPTPTLTKEEVLQLLMSTFQRRATTARRSRSSRPPPVSAKSSLYHYFPGGKADMALQVLEHLEAALEASLFEPLRSDQPPDKKLSAMLDAVWDFYGGGRQACLLEPLCASVDRKSFGRPLARVFEKWIKAVETLAGEAKLPRAIARSRAEDLVVRIEGALVVCAGTGDTKVFARTIAELRGSLLVDAPSRR